MDSSVKLEQPLAVDGKSHVSARDDHTDGNRIKARARPDKTENGDELSKRRAVVSSACLACRRRKSKCDGASPSCAACASVYGTPCVYSLDTDHRRKGVYKKDIDNLKTRNSTLQTLVSAILNYPEDEVPGLVHQIRTCESLDYVAESILAKDKGRAAENAEVDTTDSRGGAVTAPPTLETQLAGKLGAMRLEGGSTRYFGGTSHLQWVGQGDSDSDNNLPSEQFPPAYEDPVTSWTEVTSNKDLIFHLLNHYFAWHYSFFCILSKSLFWQDFLRGKTPTHSPKKLAYCTPLLVNAMLALGCHFTALPEAREDPCDSATAGDHFFREAKRLLMVNDEHEHPKLTTVQALALMSVREAGCGREAKGWVYSGMSFRMACDLGLNLDSGIIPAGQNTNRGETDEDACRITFWGCFLIDKAWSNYLGRMPQLPSSIITAPRFDVFPDEDSSIWAAYTDSGYNHSYAQPARTRAVALQISYLSEISSDLMHSFYNPIDVNKPKGKHSELKALSELHQRLESWKRNLPKELEPREGSLAHVILMHMFFYLLYLHLFRPFLKLSQASSPLPPSVSPRKICTHAATTISKLTRLYKRTHGLQQTCNIAVYIIHTACTVHLLNLPDRNARRDIIHGVKHLEEIADYWLCARRTIGILRVLSARWKVDLPEEAQSVILRAETKFGHHNVLGRGSQIDAARSRERKQMTSQSSPLLHSPPSTTTSPQQIQPHGIPPFADQQTSPPYDAFFPQPAIADHPADSNRRSAHLVPSPANTASNFQPFQPPLVQQHLRQDQTSPQQPLSVGDSPPMTSPTMPVSSGNSEAGMSPGRPPDWWPDNAALSAAGMEGNGGGWVGPNIDGAGGDAWMNVLGGGPPQVVAEGGGGGFGPGGEAVGQMSATVPTTPPGAHGGMMGGGLDVLSGLGGLNALNAYNMAPYEEDWYR